MTEFYEFLSDEEVSDLIKKKLRLYDESIQNRKPTFGKIPLPYDSIIYEAYAKLHKLEIGEFELYMYKGMIEGIDMYSFYVRNEATK